MKLPSMKFADGISKSRQIKFGGMNHNPGAKDGELWDMRNLTADRYPLLSTRNTRGLIETLAQPGGLYSHDGLCWVDGTEFYYRGEKKGEVTMGQKVFCSLGAYIVIFPDKCYYNVNSGEFGSLEAKWSGDSLTFTNGLLYGEDATANTLCCEGVQWEDYFRSGDAVSISGCTKHSENNKTVIIRQINGDKLYFYENIFTLDGDGQTEYTETGEMKVERTVPDLKFLCENENRLWGCNDTTIYACKQGDVFNWNSSDGLADDSWAVSPGSAGEFTGCISYKGYPTFFKEDHIYKVYGSLPSNFQVMTSATLGLAQGSEGSLAIAGETLFYLSGSGVMAYTGGIPQPISRELGSGHFHSAVAGSDGLKYYVSMEDGAGDTALYVYDTQRGLWHKEDETRATHFAKWGASLYYLNADGHIWITEGSREETAQPEESIEWMAEFSDFTEEDPNKKGVAKLQIRLELDLGATVRVWIQFDSDGQWRQAGGALGESVKRSYYLPVIPTRCDHYRIRLTGTGGCRIHSMVRETYSGSELFRH